MYIYDKQSDIMHRNHPKHSNFENMGSRPQKSKNVCQRGVEGVSSSYGRPKLTLVSKKEKNCQQKKGGVKKS